MCSVFVCVHCAWLLISFAWMRLPILFLFHLHFLSLQHAIAPISQSKSRILIAAAMDGIFVKIVFSSYLIEFFHFNVFILGNYYFMIQNSMRIMKFDSFFTWNGFNIYNAKIARAFGCHWDQILLKLFFNYKWLCNEFLKLMCTISHGGNAFQLVILNHYELKLIFLWRENVRIE